MERKHNTGGRLVSALTLAKHLANRAAFQRGYASIKCESPYDYDIASKEEAIAYARGRAFAIWTQLRGWKDCRWKNGKLSAAATERLVHAIHARAIL